MSFACDSFWTWVLYSETREVFSGTSVSGVGATSTTWPGMGSGFFFSGGFSASGSVACGALCCAGATCCCCEAIIRFWAQAGPPTGTSDTAWGPREM